MTTPELPKGHVALRFDEATLARLDALLLRVSDPSHPLTRSDLLRAVILQGLALVELDPRSVAVLAAPDKSKPPA